MRGVRVIFAPTGRPDPAASLSAAFAPIPLPTGPAAVLGIFVHQGAHYTAMISRAGILYHIDSLPVASGDGRYVYEVSAELFLQYVEHFAQAAQRPTRDHPRVGGLFRVFYTGVLMQ